MGELIQVMSEGGTPFLLNTAQIDCVYPGRRPKTVKVYMVNGEEHYCAIGFNTLSQALNAQVLRGEQNGN